MDRARRAALIVVVMFLGVTAALEAASPVDPPGGAIAPVADVAWPPSSGLLVGEVVTGGASASDEYVEIVNAGSVAMDVAGTEVVYVTASGSTVTRKATWVTTSLVEPGRRILLANAAGAFAPIADLTYTGGFAATGGAVALRAVGGEVIDSIGWGDATSGFVEGGAPPAPPAGSSLERLPGAGLGNWVDTNDNATDLVVDPTPEPRNSLAGPLPAPAPSPDPSMSPSPEPASPTPSPSPGPSMEPSPAPASPSPEPASPSPDPEPSLPPSADPSIDPSVAPSLEPSPIPEPSPSPDPTSIPIVDARAMPDGSEIVVEGTVTIGLGALEAGRGGFIQDDSAGIAVYLAPALSAVIPAGTVVRLLGTVDDRFGQRTIRVASDAIVSIGPGELPGPGLVGTGDAREANEGRRLTVSGTATSSPDDLADGMAFDIDDGSGALRIVAGPEALPGATVAIGDLVTATGVLGQRDSTGSGAGGYRLYVMAAGDLMLSTPTPSPSSSPSAQTSPSPSGAPSPAPSTGPSADPSAPPSPSTSPRPSPTPSPDPSPTTAPATISIAEARTVAIGKKVSVVGVVTAERGRLGHPDSIAIEDVTGGIVVRLRSSSPAPVRGAAIAVTGVLAEPFGLREIRPREGELVDLGPGAIVAPRAIRASGIGESAEARLVSLTGIVSRAVTRTAGGDLTFEVRDATGVVRVVADASAGIDRSSIRRKAPIRVVGVVGQRATRKGRLDGYRLWLRDQADIAAVTGTPGAFPSPGSGSPPPGSGSPTPSTVEPAIVAISKAILVGGETSIEGVVLAGAALLDASGRRIVVADGSAGIEVLLPSGTTAPRVGTTVRVSGLVGRAYGAPRMRAETIRSIGRRRITPIDSRRPPGPAHEWRLVRVTGTVVDLRRLGGRWRLELRMPGGRQALVDGLASAGIDPGRVAEGRRVAVVGIVRRPYPTATDRRFAVLPRSGADVAVLGAPRPSNGGRAAGASRPDGTSAPAGSWTGASVRVSDGGQDADLDRLADHVGELVRVGGLVVEVAQDAITIDDGTAISRVVLTGEAAAFLPLLEPADAVNIVGRVRRRGDDGFEVVADAGSAIARVGDPTLDEPLPDAPIADSASSADPTTAKPGTPRAVGLLETADLGGGLGAPLTGIASLAIVSLASIAVTILRRRRADRRLAKRVVERLATLTRPPDPA